MNVAVSNYEPSEEKEFDQIVVWFNKKPRNRVMREGTNEALADNLAQFSQRMIVDEDMGGNFIPYTEYDPEYWQRRQLNSQDASVNPRTGKTGEPFAFSKQSNVSYKDMVDIAYADDGIVGRERVVQTAEAFQKGRRQKHRGIREDQLALILGAGIGEYIPAVFRDPRDGHTFNGILRVTSKDGEQVVEVDKDLGIEKVRRVQELVSTVYDADEKVFISLPHGNSTEAAINQRKFLSDNWNSRAIQEIIKNNLTRTFDPPSIEELKKTAAPSPLRLLGPNFKMRLMYNQFVSAMNTAELLMRGDPAFLIAEQGSGKSKTYMGVMELANMASALMVVPEQLTAVLSRELAETLHRVTTFSLDTVTLNFIRMKPESVLPHEWEEIIRDNYPDVEQGGQRRGVRMTWEDAEKGVLVVDFTNAQNGPNLRAFTQFARNFLDSPVISGGSGMYRLVHDYNPVSQENLREILNILPEGSTGFVEHTESMRFTVPTGADKGLLKSVKDAIPGSKASSITFTQFWVGRSRAVSRDPVVYQLDAARAAAEKPETSPENPVYTLAPFTMLTQNHQKVSSLQTWRAIEQKTMDENETLDGDEMVTSQILPPMAQLTSDRPMRLGSDINSPEYLKALAANWKAYRAKAESRMALACPECLEMVREKKKSVVTLLRPHPDANPLLMGADSGNLIQGDHIADLPVGYSEFLDKIAVRRSANSCASCGAALGASYWQKCERSKGRATVRLNDKLAAIEYLTSTRMKNVFDCVIFDEAHKVKGMDSARGIAAGKIFDACKSVLLGTATLNNGFADSFFRAFRTIPEFREEYGIKEVARFQDEYGFTEFIRDLEMDDDKYSSTSDRKHSETKEKKMPGVKGEFIKWLLPYMVSMKLHDVKEMRNLDEFLVGLDVEEDLFDKYKMLLTQLENVLDMSDYDSDATTAGRVISDMRNLGITLLNAPYRGIDKRYPRPGIEDEYGDYLPDPDSLTEDEFEEIYYPRILIEPSFTEKLTKKEQRLLTLFKDAFEDDPDAKILAFVHFTGKLNYVDTGDENNLISRLRRLGGEDIQMGYLGENVPTANRTAHIEDMVAEGAQVVFVNPKRVAEGVTLNMMTHIVFFETPSEPAVKSQASRRSYRLNQNKDICVYIMYYSQTVQELEMALMQNKDAVDRIVSGEMPAVDEMNRDIVNPDDALLMIVRQQVKNGKGDLPERLQARQNEDTSLLLTQRSHFIGEEDYVRRMRGVSLEEWVETEYAHLRNFMEEPYRRASWLGFTPPASALSLPEPTDLYVGGDIPEVVDAAVVDNAAAPTTPNAVNEWFSAFNGVEQVEPAEDDDPIFEPKAVADAWATAFFGGDADVMAATAVRPRRRR